MQNVMRYLSILVTLISISCEKEVGNAKVPLFIPKLVLTSFLSPSDSISCIDVNSNKPLYGDLENLNPIGTLTGKISDGEKEIVLKQKENKLFFTSNDMQIINGKTYRISVSSDKNMKAGGTCTIPVDFDLKLMSDTFSILRHGEIPEYREWREFRARVIFTDQPGSENYYRLYGRYVGFITKPQSPVPEYYSEYVWIENELMTDRSADNEGNIITEFNLNRSYTYYDSAFLKIYILNTEESYYLYHKSLDDYTDNENPFSESTPVFSNIEGGLGVFTSYSIDSIVIRLK
jgi:hypothetical protein